MNTSSAVSGSNGGLDQPTTSRDIVMQSTSSILSQGGSSSPDTPHFNLRLIDAVRRCTCIYDANDRMYRSSDYKIKIWNRLVQQLQFRGDARTLYNRWKQLRDKYGKEKKKFKHLGGQSPWQYFKHLTSLDVHMVDRSEQKFRKAQQYGEDYDYRPIVITDPKFDSNLVHHVRQYPCLYDIRDPKYRHTECRNKAWADIIKDLNFPGDINAIYKQWKKLRDRYVREKRKMRMSNTSNSGAEDMPGWDLYQELTWLEPFLDERAAQVKRRRESSAELSGDEFEDAGVPLRTPKTVVTIAAAVSQPSTSQAYITTADTQAPHLLQQQPAQPLQQYIIMPIAEQPTRYSANPIKTHTIAGAAGSQQSPLRPVTVLPKGTTMVVQSPSSSIAGGGAALAQHGGNLQQQVIVANDTTLDGDRSFAVSVVSDLNALPDQVRQITRAQILHFLQNSKITILKA